MDPNAMIKHPWKECERGNVWLVDDDGGHNAWLRLQPGYWLQLSIRLDNYPGLNVSTLKATDDELARHIQSECGGMMVRKCNLDGVSVVRERVVEIDE